MKKSKYPIDPLKKSSVNMDSVYYSNLVNNNTNITTRVQVAQCKINGFGTKRNIKDGFRELYLYREYKESWYPLGCYYYDQSNFKQSLYWFKKCNSSMSKYRIAILYYLKYNNKQEKSLYYMLESAHLGNKYAQFMLGVYYQHGILVKQSIIDAKTWYERSANQEFAEAQTALANLMLKGKEEDEQNAALLWLYKAEYLGNASAFIRLGSLHEEGILVQGDNIKALDYYKRATLVPLISNHISSIAHYLVGINYRLGDLGLEQDNLLAFNYLSISANLGYPPAQRTLAIMYAEGIGTTKDLEKSFKLFKSAADHGDIRSLCLIADISKKNKIELYINAATLGSINAQLSLAQYYQRIEQLENAFKWFEIASKSTIATSTPTKKNKIPILDVNRGGFLLQRNTARLMVARYRYNGWGGVNKEPLKAFQGFKLLSEEEFSDAYYWLAACYEEIEHDLDLAFQYYKKSAISGDIDGQFQVAFMLSNGFINKEKQYTKNIQEAYFWYQKAADRGHGTAQYSLGLYFEHGLCIEINIEKAIYWYRLASENNLTLAMIRLARLLDNIQECIHWLDKAISIGDDVSALRELATFYKNGLIEDHDNQKKAFQLYQKAANQNDPMSWHALSKFYQEESSVVPVNLEMAIHCLKMAEDLGYPVAGLDLADVYYKNQQIQEATDTYQRLVKEHDLKSIVGWKARLALAKIIVFETGLKSTTDQQLRVYSWLINMQSKRSMYQCCDDFPQIFEILGYCAEFGIGTPLDKKQSIRWYESCANEEGGDWAIKRSLCRLVNYYMDKKSYQKAQRHLEKLKPDLDDMCKLSEDAIKQACRMMYHLGYLYKYGLGGMEKNEDLAMDYFTDAADHGDIDATYELGKSLLQIDDEEAKHRFEEGAMEGHAGCMRELAILLLFEESDQCMLDDDPDEYDGAAEIVRLLELAAELNDVEATYQLALVYENGLGSVLIRDIEKALPMYIKAAELGHEHAMVKTGELLGNSLGQHADAIHWFQKAATKSNNIKARVMLLSYAFQGFNSSFVEQLNDTDNFQALHALVNGEAETIKEMEKQDFTTAEKVSTMDRDGLGLAFYILGQCHELGRGTPTNITKAKEWYHQSALVSKNVEAMWRLGCIYYTIEGNEAKALEWYRNAAEKGRHRESHYQLGLFHLNGLGGLEKNMVAAQKYLTKASDQGHSPATYELAHIVWNRNKDHIYGYELYKVAGQMHVSGALRELGHLSHTGFTSHGIHIVNQDYKRAFAYYCEAAQLGDPIAALMVGNYFEEGYLADDLGQDSERALQWYESAYRLNGGGLAELAIGKLKHIMADTMTDPKDADDMREEAFVWFESAAINPMDPNQETFAKVMVALYHLHGWGRKPQDAKTGFEMLLSITESSTSNLALLLLVARCYEGGMGTDCNIEKAVHYYNLAANMNDKSALIRVGEIYEQGLLFGKVDKETADTYYRRAIILS